MQKHGSVVFLFLADNYLQNIKEVIHVEAGFFVFCFFLFFGKAMILVSPPGRHPYGHLTPSEPICTNYQFLIPSNQCAMTHNVSMYPTVQMALLPINICL